MRNIQFNLTAEQILKVLCPDCKKETRHRVIQSVDMDGRADISNDYWIDWESKFQIIECQGCLYTSFRSEDKNSEDMDPRTGKSMVREQLFPRRSKDFLQPKYLWNVPKNLRRIYREVIDCYNNETYTLCAAGLRAIIEGLCIDQNVKAGPVEVTESNGNKKIKRKKNLEGKIAGLHETGLLSKKHAEILHEHRFLGNKAVHELEQPSIDELRLAIQIMEHTLENIYELPEKAQELIKKKKKRKKNA